MVPKGGFEPPWVAPHGPQPCLSTKYHHFGNIDAGYLQTVIIKHWMNSKQVRSKNTANANPVIPGKARAKSCKLT